MKMNGVFKNRQKMSASGKELLHISWFSVVEQSCGLTALWGVQEEVKTSCTSLVEAAEILLHVGTVRDGGGGGCSTICILTDPVSRFPGQTSTDAAPGKRRLLTVNSSSVGWGGGGRGEGVPTSSSHLAGQKVPAEIYQAERGRGCLSRPTCLISD